MSKKEDYASILEKALSEVRRDVEESDSWTVVKNDTKEGIILKKRDKKGRGSETPCFKATAEVALSPSVMLHDVVLDKSSKDDVVFFLNLFKKRREKNGIPDGWSR
jgi:hypothetical protein